jgi:hypothetical protein
MEFAARNEEVAELIHNIENQQANVRELEETVVPGFETDGLRVKERCEYH